MQFPLDNQEILGFTETPNTSPLEHDQQHNQQSYENTAELKAKKPQARAKNMPKFFGRYLRKFFLK